jgi:hypothetical protein
MKICSRCHQEKPLSDFHKRADRRSGVQSHCKSCQKVRKDKYLSTGDGIVKSKDYRVKYYLQNKESILEENKCWREKNKDRRRKYLFNYEHTKRERDPMLVLEYAKRYMNKRYRNNPKFRLCRLVSSCLRRSLGVKKNGLCWEKLLDFSYDDLVERLKTTMPDGYLWSDYELGKTDLEIDHIIPISAFNFSSHSDIDFKRCWSINNLQLIPKTVNLRKKDSIERPFQPCLSLSI